MKYKVLFLGTADFAIPPLESLIQSEDFEVVCVVSQPDKPAGRKLQLKASPVKEFALKNILKVVTPKSVNAEEVQRQIAKLNCDLAVVVAFGQILKQSFLDLFPMGAVNVHGSILPRWRGAAPIQRALMAGDKTTGVSLQQIVLKLDAGDVISSREAEITNQLDAISLYQILKQQAGEIIREDLKKYVDGKILAQKQDEKYITIADKIKKSEGLIDWTLSAKEIFHKYQGLKMWPGVWTRCASKNLKLHQLELLQEDSKFQPGQISQINKDNFVVQCASGQLRIFEVQMESRAKQKVVDFLNGGNINVGQKLDD